VTDVYDERASEATEARPEAQEAAAMIARTVPIEGLSDPAYIANIIEDEMRRFEEDPGAPIIESPWPGADSATGNTVKEMIEETKFKKGVGTEPFIVKAARAATIRIARAYSPSVRTVLSEFLEWTPQGIAQSLTRETWPARAADVEESLRQIQAHRRALGMRPLDAHAAGWTEEDVLDEAERIRILPNPLQDLKHRLI